MTVTNVSTYGSLQTLLQNMSQVQNDLNTAQGQISSGKVSETFDGLNGSIEQFTSLTAQVSRLQDYQQSNSLTLNQLQTSNTALGQIEQIATTVKSLIASQLSNTSGTAAFDQQLQSNLSSLSAELNTSFQGKYIFGGTQTTTPPVVTPLPTPATIGTPDAAYYQGSAQDSTFRIADGQEITNGIRADNTSFQQILAGVQQALADPGDTSALQNAESLVDTGIQGTIALQSTVNANIVTVQQVDTQSQTLQTYYQGLTQNMSQADVVSLSTQVAQDQTVLEASFSTFARISSLTLASYLK